ncbi:hypothetical protein [Natronorubrum sp. DTA28]|uniref:hypothetical protein n=1 Tax=Natronorubrum sp. DTA28 TaxID=3447019 RepID=UPI003F873535
MGWIRDLLLSTGNTVEDVQPQREERFPLHTYGPGYPIVVTRQELNDLTHLLEIESKTPDGWENASLLSREDFEEIVEDTIGDIGEDLPSPEERRSEVSEILESWQEHLTGPKDAVWTTTGIGYHFDLYINYCETRAESEGDEFKEPDELDTARKILSRIQTAQDSDAKLAVVHKRHLPLEEPKEDSAESS